MGWSMLAWGNRISLPSGMPVTPCGQGIGSLVLLRGYVRLSSPSPRYLISLHSITVSLTMAKLSQRALGLVNSVSGDTCIFIFGTEESPFLGGQRVVFALQSSSAKRFAVQVEQHLSDATRSKVEWEIQLLRDIREARIPRLPRLIGFELEPIPPLIATNWADGHELEWSDSVPPPDVRKHVLQAIAELTLDMLRIQKPGKSVINSVMLG
jgi:hypothetical protein|uniref:Uncharacterized protein n=1 Tax=Bionectria ochroleuca TaxID=29856 RepID=A0A8H7NMF4_BIOOC